MVKNVVQTGFQVANKVQENLSASNIQDKVISFIPECVNKISTTLNKKKVAAVMGMQNSEPCGVQTSRKSTSLIPKRKTTTTFKASALPKSKKNPFHLLLHHHPGDLLLPLQLFRFICLP